MKIGVYVCECGINIAATVDVERVAEYAKDLPNVAVSRYYKYMCSEPGQQLIKKDIREFGLDRIVVASCSPRMHEPTFQAVLKEEGLNPYFFEMANIREQCSWVHKDKEAGTKKAMDLVAGAVFRAEYLQPIENIKVGVTPNALVIGGGIAGIQAALDIADMGYKTYLVEKEPSIGGRMAQLDKTFPTLDCSACILTPKMVDVVRNKNIELLTYSEITDIDGYVGNFKVKIKKKPRYIDLDKCTGCGECTKKCPVEEPNEFDLDMGIRKATYIPFPQAIPLKYTIEKRGIQPCRNVCPAGVGAPGYVTLVGRGKFYEALRVIKDRLPFPSICGRICHRPCESACTRNEIDDPIGIAHLKRFVGDLELKIPIVAKPPIDTRSEKVAIIGGGPAGLTAAHDLALKGYHVTIFEAEPVLGGMMKWGIPPFRLPKEILRREISDIMSLGIRVFLNTKFGKDITLEEIQERGYDAIFLAMGAQQGKTPGLPNEELEGVSQSIDFLKKGNLGTMDTTPIANVDDELCIGCGACISSCPFECIYEKKDEIDSKQSKKRYPLIIKELCVGCGKCASECPSKAIKLGGLPDTKPKLGDKVIVVGGGNAALDTARSALRLGSKEVSILYRRSRLEMPAEPEWEIDETEAEGVNLIYLAAPIKINGENGRLKSLDCIKMKLGDTDKSGRRSVTPIEGSEFTMEVDSLIFGIGQEVDFLELGDKIDLTRRGLVKIDPVTLETSVPGIFSGGDAVVGSGTVIGAIGAGKEAAESIDRYINNKDLRDGRTEIREIARVPTEGVKKRKKVPMRYLPIEERKNNFLEVELGYSLEEAIEEARRCLNCGGCVECYECVYACEANAIDHNMKEEEIEIEVGAIIVATGYDLMDAALKPEYGYGKIKNVITGLEFERLVNASGPTQGKIKIKGKEPKKVVFISCVGSREKEGNEYCSRVCCMYTAKQAHMVKDKIPDSELTVFYTDVRAFGKGFEEFYNRVQAEGIDYKRRELDDKIEVIREKGKTIVRAEGYDDIEADLVVLANAIVPRADSDKLAKLLRVSHSPDGFLLEAHPKLRPIDTFTSGIFLAGCCQSPKDIPDTVAQASGAASRAGEILSKDKLEVKGEVAVVDESLCIACLTCVRSCPYGVPVIGEQGVAEIEAAKCEGCGTCTSVCPAKAIKLQHYYDDQLIAKCKGILLEAEE